MSLKPWLKSKRLWLLLSTRIVVLLLLYIAVKVTLDSAKYDWILAGGSIFFTFMYIYIYKLAEARYIKSANDAGAISKRLFSFFIYLNRWLFFIIFLVLEAIVLIEWGFLKPVSGEAIIAVFWMAVLAAMYLELANIQKALSFRIKWPENQIRRDIIYSLYLVPVSYLFILAIVHAFFTGSELLELNDPFGRLFRELASGAVIASIFAALLNLYLVKIRGWISYNMDDMDTPLQKIQKCIQQGVLQEDAGWKDYPTKIDDRYSFQSFGLMQELADLWHGQGHVDYPFFKNYLHQEENDDLELRCIASSDLLISTKDAIVVFKKRQRNMPLKGLDIFGIFQALVVQQDAVNVLYQILLKRITIQDDFVEKIKRDPFWKQEDKLIKIRDIRNELIGHPATVRRKQKKEYVSTNIMRIDRNNYIGSSLYDVSQNKRSASTEFPTTDIQKCLKEQDETLLKYLKQIFKSIKR